LSSYPTIDSHPIHGFLQDLERILNTTEPRPRPKAEHAQYGTPMNIAQKVAAAPASYPSIPMTISMRRQQRRGTCALLLPAPPWIVPSTQTAIQSLQYPNPTGQAGRDTPLRQPLHHETMGSSTILVSLSVRRCRARAKAQARRPSTGQWTARRLCFHSADDQAHPRPATTPASTTDRIQPSTPACELRAVQRVGLPWPHDTSSSAAQQSGISPIGKTNPNPSPGSVTSK
jgi:hypothetical protein